VRTQELFDLQSSIAVVTGGAGHLGYAISEALAEAGAEVYIASRNAARCREVARKIEADTGASSVNGITVDIRSTESIKQCFAQIAAQSGRIDILVNNASFGASGAVETMTEDEWLTGIDGTVNGVFRCIQAIVPVMAGSEFSSIINIASMYGMVSPDPSIYGDTGYDNPPNYGAGKAAIIQFTRYAACHLAAKGIRVNTISPGPFPNPEIQKSTQFISNLVKRVPLGRIGQPYEIKGAVVFLASRASTYVTGVNIPVDGGWTAW